MRDISYINLVFTLFLLAIPIYASFKFNLKIAKKTLISTFRMIIQLFLIGIFLKFIFVKNSILLNLLWLMIMITVASYTITESSSLKIKKFILPTAASITVSTFFIMFYFK